MSPEQARGDDVDRRTDLWSLGVVIFELVSGRLPFAGEYEKAVMYGILNEMPPPLTSLRTGVPMGLEWIVTKLLAKSPDERYQSCADLIVDLKTVDLSASGMSRQFASVGSQSAIPNALQPRLPAKISSWLALLLLPLGLGLGWILFGGSGTSTVPTAPSRMFQLNIEGALQFGAVKVTHDGTRLVGMMVDDQRKASISSVNLRTGEIKTIVPVMGTNSLSISLDDQWIAYQGQGALMRVRLQGGTSVSLLTADLIWGSTWLPDGSIVVSIFDSEGRVLWQIPASGEDPFIISRPDSSEGQSQFSWPIAFGDRGHIMVTMREEQGRYRMGIIGLKAGQFIDLGPGSPVAYVESGHLIYFESDDIGGRLLARPFDAERLAFLGPPITLEENADRWRVTIDRFGTYYSASMAQGTVNLKWEARVYVDGTPDRTIAADLEPGTYQPRLSPDGSRVMMRVTVGDHEELHEFDLERDIVRLFTVESDGDADNAAWSRDGRELIFELNDKLYRRYANGSGETVEIPTTVGTGAMDWAPSGEWLVHTARNINGYSELYRIDLASGESEPLDGGPGLHGWPRISPDE